MMIEIPPTWRHALAAVQSVCPAILAGGSLRDLDNGREVKDIDIFIRGSQSHQLENMIPRLSQAGFKCDAVDPSDWYPVGDGNDVVGHFDAHFPGIEQPVQIIMVDFPLDRICDRFDFGICRLAFDGSSLIETAEYGEDKEEKIFRLRRQRTDMEMVASVHRYARLSRKYDGWRFGLFDDLIG